MDAKPFVHFLQTEIFAKIGAARLRVVDEGISGAGKEHLPFLDEIGAVDDGKNLAGVVVGDEDADLLLLEEADEVLDVGDGEGVDVGKGFVEEKERGLRDEGAGDFQTAPLAAGESGGSLVAQMSEMELLEERLKREIFVGKGLENAEDVLLDGKGAENGGLLREIAKAEMRPFVNGKCGDVLPLEEDFTAFRLDKANGDVEGGGLAGAVGAKKADNFARLYVKGEAVKDWLAAVALDEIFSFKKVHK